MEPESTTIGVSPKTEGGRSGDSAPLDDKRQVAGQGKAKYNANQDDKRLRGALAALQCSCHGNYPLFMPCKGYTLSCGGFHTSGAM
jgi:hypothetical protein